MTLNLSEPQALPDLIAGYRLVTRLRDDGVFDWATWAGRVDAMRSKAGRLGLAREFREGCQADQAATIPTKAGA